MAHAPRRMIACRPANDKRTAPRSARRAVVTQLDLFGPPRARRKLPFTPERLTSIALGVWRASRPVQGTLGERLFRDLRLDVPGPDVVRFHHALKRGDERCPGLVWLLRPRGEPCGILRIYLDADGRAVELRALGRLVGATVMPRPP